MNGFSSLDLMASVAAVLTTAAFILGVRTYLSKDRADWFSKARRHFWLRGTDGTKVSFLLHEDESLDDGVSRALDQVEQKNSTRSTALIG